MAMNLLVLTACAVGLSDSAQGPGVTLTVDEIISQHQDAVGGLDKLRATKSLRMTGTISGGPVTEAPVVLEFKDGKFRMDVTLRGTIATRAYDGKEAWKILPTQGTGNAERMSHDESQAIQEQADLHGPLVDYKGRGYTVDLAGEAVVEEADAYRLRISLKNGDVRYSFLDKESFLLVKSEVTRRVLGGEVEMESFTSDYKDVGGILLPHVLETAAKGAPVGRREKITIKKIEVNPTLDDARFVRPGGPMPIG